MLSPVILNITPKATHRATVPQMPRKHQTHISGFQAVDLRVSVMASAVTVSNSLTHPETSSFLPA